MARAVIEDFYEILEVPQHAALETIRESFKKLALRFHPDKNRDESATAAFQLLSRAWETLRDGEKRREYDRIYVTAVKRKSLNEAGHPRSRRQEVNRNFKEQWARNADVKTQVEIERLERARAWRSREGKDYSTRLEAWTVIQKKHFVGIRPCRDLIKQNQRILENLTKESEEDVVRQFTEAIHRSSKPPEKHSEVLAKLMEARRRFIVKLGQTISDAQNRLTLLNSEISNNIKKFEIEESTHRQVRIREALDILGPRNLKPPLFSIIDRRGQAINYWNTLSRTKISVEVPIPEKLEGPWHQRGNWERVCGEQICERCAKQTFHILMECSAAKCPGCGIIVCYDCHRELEALREHEEWMISREDLKDSLFSLEFRDGDGPIMSSYSRCFDDNFADSDDPEFA